MDPFIFNPAAAKEKDKSDANESLAVMWVANERVGVEIEISNPTHISFQVRLHFLFQ